jgi:hypothetical protein
MAEADPALVETAAIETPVPADQAPRRRWGRLALMLLVPVLVLIGGGLY